MKEIYQQRRKILKAGVAAPLILTVRPSSATALASNRCLERDNLKPPPSNVLCDTPDEWLRMKCNACELSYNGVKQKYSDGTKKLFIRNISGTCYYQLDRYSPNTVTPTTCSYVPGAPGVVEAWPTTPCVKQVLVKIDTTGVPCAYHWEATTVGQKCTNSCWTSLRPKTV